MDAGQGRPPFAFFLCGLDAIVAVEQLAPYWSTDLTILWLAIFKRTPSRQPRASERGVGLNTHPLIESFPHSAFTHHPGRIQLGRLADGFLGSFGYLAPGSLRF